MFIEIQNRLADDNRQLAAVTSQIQLNEREIRLAELTNKELSTLPESTKTYRSAGKM
jgi:prefoldin subunit 1